MQRSALQAMPILKHNRSSSVMLSYLLLRQEGAEMIEYRNIGP